VMQGIVPLLQVEQTVSDTEETLKICCSRSADTQTAVVKCVLTPSVGGNPVKLNGAPSPMISDFNHGTRPTTNPVN